MTFKQYFILFTLIIFSSSVFASNYFFSLSTQYKQLGTLSKITYLPGIEVMFLPGVSAYYKYGMTSLTDDIDKYNNNVLGLRTYLPVTGLFFGVGYESIDLKFKEAQSQVRGSGSIKGPFAELGKEFLGFLGFLGLGLKLNATAHLADVKIQTDNSSTQFLSSLNQGSILILNAGVEVSYKF